MINALCQDKSQTKNPVLKGFGKKKRLRVFLLIEVCLLLWFWGVLEFWVYGFGGLGFVVVWGLFFCWGNKLKYVGTVLGFLKAQNRTRGPKVYFLFKLQSTLNLYLKYTPF